MKYVPLFDGILESTLWDESLEVRTLYFTMLLLMDPDFVVRLDFEKVARKARLRPDRRENYQVAVKALEVLKAPDTYTAAEQKDDGIRVKELEDGSYFVVNGEKYQELMYAVNQARRRKKAQRERRAAEKAAGKPIRKTPKTAAEQAAERFTAEGKHKEAERALELDAAMRSAPDPGSNGASEEEEAPGLSSEPPYMP